jgi:sulfate transport system ATP-binding protein
VRDGVFTTGDGIAAFAAPGCADGPVAAHLRPHELGLASEQGGADAGIRARVLASHRRADRITVELEVGEHAKPFEWDMIATPGIVAPVAGEALRLKPSRVRFYPRQA